MEFSRQEYWSGLPFPTPGDLPNPGIKPCLLAQAGRFLITAPLGRPGHGIETDSRDFLLNSWDVLGRSFGRSCYSERVERILLGSYQAGNVSRFRQRGSFTSGEFLNVFFLMTQMFTSADPSLVWVCFPSPWWLPWPTRQINLQWSKPETDRCKFSQAHSVLFSSLYIHVWKHLLVFMWRHSETMFGKMSLFLLVGSRPL